MAINSTGTLYVTDYLEARICRQMPDGQITVLAGTGFHGFQDGTTARFNYPSDVAVDSSGNVYVTDHVNHRIRKITPAGMVSTIAGTGAAAFGMAPANATQFRYPNGVAVDSSGNVYVTDHVNHRIRKITPAARIEDRVVSTLAGTGTSDFADGTGSTAARFKSRMIPERRILDDVQV